MKHDLSTPGALILVLCVLCIAVILYGLNKTLDKSGYMESKKQWVLIATALCIFAWAGLLSLFAYNGFFTDFSKLPPRVVFALLLPLPFVLFIAFSKTGTKLLRSVPPQWLVFMQSFRILVEVLLWMAFLANKLPVQMTFEGRNFDVLSGILAIPVGYLVLKKIHASKKLAIAYNVIGLLLLINILVVAVLSMPTSFRYFMNEPSNTLVAQFPFILLPGILVPIAYSFHIFSLRQLLLKK
ncbi:MAG TPA: hypothetical protein VK489_01295 [Ferruginibacter sp.]|nr:hypothetical protein [Ferruginibacter sp.]